jgi:glucose/arabinose dehydrogenase
MSHRSRRTRRLGAGCEQLETRWALAADFIDGFAETPLASGLDRPTAMAVAPDGRIFVMLQAGDVRVIKNGVLLGTKFMDLAVNDLGERGLLGFAFDPNFASNHFVYAYYTTATSPIHNRVSRFVANGDVVQPGSETVLLELDNLSDKTNHNGGAIHFGKDGKLYIAVGDNANGSNAQSLGNLLGKVLRINKTPGDIIPDDNPFVDTPGARGEIWALGLRNPFTFSVRPDSGQILVNDVGQNTWEEINHVVKGGNYGWPTTEGPTDNPAFISPVFAYQHDVGQPQGRAITGGAFYNPPFNLPADQQFPGAFRGDYFFADYLGAFIWRYDVGTDTASPFATGVDSPVDLQVGRNGDLLYLSRFTGTVTAVRYVNDAPLLEIGGDRTFVEGSGPITIAPTGTITDVDSPNFNFGRLTAQLIVNSGPDDRLGIRNSGSISTSGNNVLFDSQNIGTFSGGAGANPLVIEFNANATPARAQTLLRNLTFRNISNNPSGTPRTLRVQVADGDFGPSNPDSKLVDVTPVNDRPVLSLSGSVGYQQNSSPVQLSPSCTVKDLDSANFAGGLLTIQITSGASAANRLTVAAPFTVSGNNILLDGQVIGTRNSGGGQGFTSLVITFTNLATPSVAQRLVRAIRFSTVDNNTLAQRTIEFTISDGDGGTSDTRTKTVNVTA